MTAKEMFEALGYSRVEDSTMGIQYIKKSNRSEMQRIGMLKTKYMEFYRKHKDITIKTITEFIDGSKSNSNLESIDLEEFKAIQKQVLELGWK
ncbi:hypothetical protein D3C76_1665550 [compost metagenome]